MTKLLSVGSSEGISLLLLFLIGAVHGGQADTAATGGAPLLADTAVSIDELQSKANSTLLFGGSKPASFSGEGRTKMQHHYFRYCPAFMSQDKSWNNVGWEGNESMVRIGMVVRPNRNTVLWSKLGFQHTMPGRYRNPSATNDTNPELYGYTEEQGPHDKTYDFANIHEDMSAGLAIRTIPASFQLRMGNIMWIEASPLTIWKSQPRNVAWDFLPYEVEQPIARYYEYNVAKGAKEGRASWHKKAFDGINLESINLPWNLYFNGLYAAFERYDNFEREYMALCDQYAYVSLGTKIKGKGIGDGYRHAWHTRLAREKTFGDLTIGCNALGINYHHDIIANRLYWKTFGIYAADPFKIADETNMILKGRKYRTFYKEPKIGSVDLRGTIGEKLELHADLALCIPDTMVTEYDSLGVRSTYTSHLSRPSSYSGATYLHIKDSHVLPVSVDLVCIGRRFYSPFSFVAPVDAFYPFGANLLGAGKFLARGEASPYAENMAGANITVSPNIGYGHLKFCYGQHAQIDRARDLLFFPYRLNGQDLFSVFQSSYNRWANDLLDHSLPFKYDNRLGDQSYDFKAAHNRPLGPEAGGLRSDYLGMFEGFVPYEDTTQANGNLKESTDTTTVFSVSQYVPRHRKFTFNLEADAAYDISGLIGYHRDFFVAGYFALNGVATSLTPLAFSQKGQLLWSFFVRFEPAVAISEKLYLLGLAGYETWRSDLAYMKNKSTKKAENIPIDFRDYAYGLGFDWEMGSRVGLHGRAKWMGHIDRNYRENDWETPVVSMEIKMWF